MITTLYCPDCHNELHRETYLNWKKEIRLTFTCKCPTCLLNSVTLAADEWVTKDLAPYRRMNAAKAGQSC